MKRSDEMLRDKSIFTVDAAEVRQSVRSRSDVIDSVPLGAGGWCPTERWREMSEEPLERAEQKIEEAQATLAYAREDLAAIETPPELPQRTDWNVDGAADAIDQAGGGGFPGGGTVDD